MASLAPVLPQPGRAAERKTLRRIPMLRSLPTRELEDIQARMTWRSYQAGEVIWRTRGPLRFHGFIQNGEIELETWVNGVLVRTRRLMAGDPLPPRALQARRPYESVIARAVTEVRLGILPDLRERAVVRKNGWKWSNLLWPVLLVLLVIVLARDDLARITSGLLYLASNREAAALQDARSMSLLQAAQKADQGAAYAYNEEGYRWFLQNNVPDASRAFDAAVARDPGNAAALNNLAVTYYSHGDLSQAENYLERAVEQDPDRATARYNLGMTLMQSADPAGALREFQEAGFIDPRDALPLLQQAYLYQQEGDFANAEQRARSAIQLNPSLSPAHLLLGMALYAQGRQADALVSLDQALSLEPGNRVAGFYQALILGHQQQYDAALPVLYELLGSSGSGAETARILAEIDALYRLRAEPASAGP